MHDLVLDVCVIIRLCAAKNEMRFIANYWLISTIKEIANFYADVPTIPFAVVSSFCAEVDELLASQVY